MEGRIKIIAHQIQYLRIPKKMGFVIYEGKGNDIEAMLRLLDKISVKEYIITIERDKNSERNHKKDKKEEQIFFSSGKKESEDFKRRYRRLLC